MAQGPLTDRTTHTQSDPRASAVLIAGTQAFLSHGLRRTSMQTIADIAGMSRAALYLHFPNKDAIFCALLDDHSKAALEAVQNALAKASDPVTNLTNAFEVQIGRMERDILRSPHRADFLDPRLPAARAIVEQGAEGLANAYARWMAEGVQAGRLAPSAIAGNPMKTARVMLAALDGLRGLAPDLTAHTEARKRLALMFGTALTV